MPDKITEARAAVEGCPSSIFTKQDVLAILSRIEQTAEPQLFKVAPDLEKLRDLKKAMARFQRQLRNISTHNANVHLSLDGTEIIVESVELHEQDDLLEEIHVVTGLIDDMLADYTSA